MLSVFIVWVLFSILCVRSELQFFLFAYISSMFQIRLASFFSLSLRDWLFFRGFTSSQINAVSCISNALALLPKRYSTGKKWCCKFAYFVSISAELWLRSLIRETFAVDRKKFTMQASVNQWTGELILTANCGWVADAREIFHAVEREHDDDK